MWQIFDTNKKIGYPSLYLLSLFMKKLLILGCALLMSVSLSLAAPTTNAPAVLSPAPTLNPSEKLENAAKNIDRRIIFLSKYAHAKDVDGLKSLVSMENTDFYTNFLKYIETAPAFTLKRDTTNTTTHGILYNTQTNEYKVDGILSIG
jgi:hypothetical protein